MYYRLTYISSSDKSKIGDYMLNGNKPLNIGEGVSCEVQLPETEYEPQIHASILHDDDSDEWFVVRRTDCHKVLVNSEEVSVAQVLCSGDVLSFENASLKFETFNNGEYHASSGIVYKKHKSSRLTTAFTLCLAVLALGIAAFALLKPKEVDLRHSGIRQLYCQSIYHIATDSVYLLCDTVLSGRHQAIVIDSIELEQVAFGTAFLTNDSLFVTARHCIEPWISDEKWDGVSCTKMSPEVRMATWAETANRQAGYEKYTLKAHSVINKGFERYSRYSTDFHVNTSRDMVVNLGTDKKAIYWRTIFPMASRRNMELGDFAYAKATWIDSGVPQSPIIMAEWTDIEAFARSENHDIAVIGYPLNDNETDDASEVYGNLMTLEWGESQNTSEGCIPFSAPINPGNSGGPVFAKIDGKIKVIGIVSKADGHANQGMFWAVPITEVLDMHRHDDTIEKDSVIYRR